MLILFVSSSLVFIVTGLFQQLTFFTISSKAAILIIFFIWGHNQIALAFFFSTLFNKSQSALIVVFILVLCSVITSLAIEQLFLEKAAPVIIYIWPLFSFYRALGLANRASFDPTRVPVTVSDLFSPQEIGQATFFQIVTIFLYFGLSFYLDAIFPSEFGIKKPWYFPIQGLINLFSTTFMQSSDLDPRLEVDESEVRFEDEDVRDERSRVVTTDFDYSEYPLVMRGMRKVYAGRGGAGPKLAVKDVTLAIEKGITFGLLGPNGAGKSTLISILTGLYGASSGTATLAGFNIKTETSDVYKSIGICPQFDILWDELTVDEHLYFYARLKGIQPEDENRAVKEALTNVSLTAFKDRLTKGLSGGERRRVSIAIALLGSPKVVFLDGTIDFLSNIIRTYYWIRS
jgi:ABC-type Na+ transport system ATPase subunit NatA